MPQIETEQQHTISIQRHMIGKLNSSIMVIECNKCGFKWKEIWLSPSNSISSSQY
jgi:lipopolysaccharide biosynthesis regulator YciM